MQNLYAKLQFTKLSPANLGACAEMAAHAPDPWSRQSLESAMGNKNRRCFVAQLPGSPLAFACFLCVGESADLEMLVVSPAARRCAVGQRLLLHAFTRLRGQGTARILLEARAGNTAALGLYQKLGFRQLAARPQLYMHPPEDGVLMALALAL